jgi:uncharacterized protein YjiS (DUF1127 family)
MSDIGLSLPLPHFGSGFSRALATLWARWQHARLQRETRRQLDQMDDHMLQDLGVSRAQLEFEVDHASRWRPHG